MYKNVYYKDLNTLRNLQNTEKNFFILIIPITIVFGIYFFGYSTLILKDHQPLTPVSAFSVKSNLLANPNSVAQGNQHIVNNSDKEIPLNWSKIHTSVKDSLTKKDQEFLCGNNIIHTNSYVNEFITPILCSQPVGLTVDENNNVWIASGKSGTLMVFNTKNKSFDKIIKIPNWPKQERPMGSMIWDLKFDKKGDLWFTDELSSSIWRYFTKEDKFERYIPPTKDAYPISLVFDSNNNVWFTEVFGKKLGFIQTSNVINNTTKGIWELDLSKQINFQTMGPISKGYGFSKENNITNSKSSKSNSNTTANQTLWFSTANFPVGGQLVKYDITKGTLAIYDVTYTHSVPYSIAEDENGTVWANSHVANLFVSLEPNSRVLKEYATSNPSASGNLTTLPYYNEYNNGKIWFNEHYGNAIASYNPKDKTLVEYYIPTKNSLWVNSSNPLQFTIGKDGTIWFTEWSENKIGMIPKDKLDHIPLVLSTSKEKLIIDSKNDSKKSDTIDIYIYKNKTNISNSVNQTAKKGVVSDNNNALINMSVTSSVSKNGNLGNITSNFNNNSIPLSKIPNVSSAKQVPSGSVLPFKTTLEIKSTKDKSMTPGNYTMTITARPNSDIAISKIVDLEIK